MVINHLLIALAELGWAIQINIFTCFGCLVFGHKNDSIKFLINWSAISKNMFDKIFDYSKYGDKIDWLEKWYQSV